MIQRETMSLIGQPDLGWGNISYHTSVLVPGRLDAFVPDHPQLDTTLSRLGLTKAMVVETALYAWTYRDTEAAMYDVIAEHLQDTYFDRIPPEIMKEVFDFVFSVIRSTIERLEPHLYGFDRPDYSDVGHLDIDKVVATPHDPFFIVKIHYDSGIMKHAPRAL